MVDPIPEPTANEPVNDPTPDPKPAATPTKTFTQEELDQKIKARLDREKAKYADYETLKERSEKLRAFEDKDLPEIDKLRKENEKATGTVTSLTTELTGVRLENAKLRALIKAGAQPDQLDGLLKRVAGSTEEEIVADVEELKNLGWIGKQPEPVAPKPTGLGSPTKTGEPAKKSTLQEQISDARNMMEDPKTPRRKRDELSSLVLTLNRRIQKGET